MSNDIFARLEWYQEEIAKAAEQSKHWSNDQPVPRLLVVTKAANHAQVMDVIRAGIHDLADSRMQLAGDLHHFLEAQTEYQKRKKKLTWHFIGHLQSNKVNRMFERYGVLHSVDSMKLHKRICRYAKEHDLELPRLLLQVNVSADENKFGISIDDVHAFLDEAESAELPLHGLMTMPRLEKDQKKLRSYFAGLRELAIMANQQNYQHVRINDLSMGMSGDFRLAVEEGATMVRIGRGLFGGLEPGRS